MTLYTVVQSFFVDQKIDPKSGIVVAVSTGIDSMVLLDVLLKMNAKIVVAHVNHGVRKDSFQEEEFIKNYCAKKSIELEILQLHPKKDLPKGENFQHWAREKRYDFFTRIAAEYSCDFIATAHHATDKVETFFMNAFRGSGIRGITSLQSRNGHIIRPLLAFSKHEIESYAIENGIEWREDSSNATDVYLRNRVRHFILPQLDKVDRNWQAGINITLQNLENEKALIKTLIAGWENRNVRHIDDGLQISVDALEDHPAAESLLRHLLFDLDPSLPFDALARSRDDAIGSYYYGSTHRALRDRDWLIIELKNTSTHEEVSVFTGEKEIQFPAHLTFEQIVKPKSFSFNSINLDQDSALLDFDKLNFPVKIRPWQAGDKFRPLGMKGFKKISDFLIDEKISRTEKEKTFVMTSNNEIIWLIGHRIDDRFKVGEATQIMYLARLHKRRV